MIKVLLIISGTWVIQDSFASVLYYRGKPDQRWCYDQLLRIIRLLFGVVVLVCGVML